MAKDKEDSKADNPKKKSKYDEVFKLDEEISFEDALKRIVDTKKTMDTIELKFTEDNYTRILPFTNGVFKIRNLQIPFDLRYNTYRIYILFKMSKTEYETDNYYFSSLKYSSNEYVFSKNISVKGCKEISISIMPTNDATKNGTIKIPQVPEDITLTIDYNLE